MTVEEIFIKLNEHMIKGLMMHDQMASAYSFLNLCGYQKCHTYHYFDESCNYRCLQDFYLENYHKLIPETEIKNPEIIPNTWYKYTKTDVDTNTKRTAVRDMIKMWVEWETDTKKLLEESYKELYDMGEIYASRKILCFLEDVGHELKKAQDKYINLEAINYDINYIVNEQRDLYHKYKNKILDIFER